MIDCNTYRELFFDAAVGNLSTNQEDQLQAHLRGCADCRARFREQHDALAIYQQYAYEPPPESYWDGFVERLRDKIANAGSSSPPVRERVHGFEILGSVPMRVAFAAIVFALGVLVGRATVNEDPPEASVSMATSSAIAEAAVEQFLTRTQTLFLGLANAPSADADVPISAAQRRAARALLRDSRVLQRAVEERSYPTLSGIIEDTQLVLLRTAHSDFPSEQPPSEIIDELGLLLRINLYLMDHGQSNRPVNL